MDKKLSFALVGGDMRQAQLAALLANDGHTVRAYALDKCPLAENISRGDNLSELSRHCDCVVLPIPALTDGDRLNAPLSADSYLIDDLFALFHTGQTVIAGKVNNALFEKAGRSGIRLYDYLEREEFTVMNAVPTAEGAIELAMHELSKTLHGSKCLVIGFGHIGKLLSSYLKGLGADVTASARRFGDLAWISAYGYKSVQTYDISESLGDFDVIFNTVPALILDSEKLQKVNQNCICIDLASKPGGIDMRAAERLGIKAIWALSLPGKVAPASAGAAMQNTIYNILNEWGIEG